MSHSGFTPVQTQRKSAGFCLPKDLKGLKFSVLGLARSGLALAQVLIPKGAEVFLSDSRSQEAVGSAYDQALELGAQVEVGGHSERLLQCDALVISPGVSIHAGIVEKARGLGIPVLGEVELAHHLSPWPLISVTGTNGKSTTCSLVQEFLAPASFLAGNIGLPLVSEIEAHLGDSNIAWVVSEISSFQLETVHRFRPKVAVLTNITPDHLDRHKTMEEYARAKARLFHQQTAEDWAICNEDDPLTLQVCQQLRQGQHQPWFEGFPAPQNVAPQVFSYSTQHCVERGCYFDSSSRWIYFVSNDVGTDTTVSKPILEWNYPNLPGPHNLSNAVAAILVGHLLGVSTDKMHQVLKNYGRLHHRLELVENFGGVQFVDDSKATNVSSVSAALETFGSERPTVLIAGGRDKGLDLDELARSIVQFAHGLVYIGEAGPSIAEKALGCGLNPQRCLSASDMAQAVQLGFQMLQPQGGVVLLSPACTSFDMFSNAEHRGQVFQQSVRSLQQDHQGGR